MSGTSKIIHVFSFALLMLPALATFSGCAPQTHITSNLGTLQTGDSASNLLVVGANGSALPSGKLFVGYFATWAQQAKNSAADLDLARLPPYYNIINISFMNPAGTYSGNLNLSGTGIQFTNDGKMIKEVAHRTQIGIISVKIMWLSS